MKRIPKKEQDAATRAAQAKGREHPAQQGHADRLNNSPLMIAQRQKWQAMFNGAAKLPGGNGQPLQAKLETAQRVTEEEPLQSKFDAVQRVGGTGNARPIYQRVRHVSNLVGTSKRKCKCSGHKKKTWLQHYENKAGVVPGKCVAKGCRKYAQVGAHVTLLDRNVGSRVFIVPFCQYHNKRHHNTRIPLKKKTLLADGAKSSCV